MGDKREGKKIHGSTVKIKPKTYVPLSENLTWGHEEGITEPELLRQMLDNVLKEVDE